LGHSRELIFLPGFALDAYIFYHCHTGLRRIFSSATDRALLKSDKAKFCTLWNAPGAHQLAFICKTTCQQQKPHESQATLLSERNRKVSGDGGPVSYFF
jgi:hypothetical protein